MDFGYIWPSPTWKVISRAGEALWAAFCLWSLFFFFLIKCHCCSSHHQEISPLPISTAFTESAGWESEHWWRQSILSTQKLLWLPCGWQQTRWSRAGPGTQHPRGAASPPTNLGSWWKICPGMQQQFAAFDLQERFQSQGEGIIINQQEHTGRAFPSNEYLIRRAERQRQSIK